MSIFKGERINVEIFGESHAPKIGVIVSGFPKMNIDFDKLNAFLERRKPSSAKFSTARKEPDQVVFANGVDSDGKTDGTFTAEIYNKDSHSNDYDDLYGKPRPSHADYCSYLKTGKLSFTGGGKFSGRLTAPMCIAGGVAKQFLEEKGIKIYAYLSQVGKVKGKSYKDGELLESDLSNISGFPCLSNKEEMLEEIEKAKHDLDSVGGIIECVVFGSVAGLGDALFDGTEGKISSMMYSIPAVKGVEFGLGFDISSLRGSVANDEFYYDGDKVLTRTNNSGGINGGITNGMPITFRVAFRPTPSIAKTQKTVDLINKCDTEISIKGRHDSCVAVRAVPVVEGAVALALCDLYLTENNL